MVEFRTLLIPTIQQALGRVRSLYMGASNHADIVTTLDVLARLEIRRLRQLKLHNWRHHADSGENISIPPMDKLTIAVLEGMDPLSLRASMWATTTTLKLRRIHTAPTRPRATHVLDALAAATSVIVLIWTT
ncbi:hypothetical protein C8R43DRAFT_1118165 [Mycena crocata]|nr:hypothetical protein C8R43DRAFT_1118165 [Mycena crocata]